MKSRKEKKRPTANAIPLISTVSEFVASVMVNPELKMPRKLALSCSNCSVRIHVGDALTASRRQMPEKYHNGPELIVVQSSL